MFLVRRATADDAPTLLKLAKMVHFINLPADLELIRGRIARSRKSFAGNADDQRKREFMFVLVDTDTDNVIGTSSLLSCMSWPGRPHTYLQVRKRELYSKDLQTGQVHLTLQLGTDETGPAELGGLVLGPSYRGHVEKLGMFLSLVRFHFVGCHRAWFPDRLIAEMMGPLTPDSRNLFWNAFGRRFINLSFAEADLFCQVSKEFITSLFPKEEIYVSLLPPAARNQIGKVGPETEPAKKMLEGIGFEWLGHVDPFDGGPYLEADVGKIELVTSTKMLKLGKAAKGGDRFGFVSLHRDGDYRAVRTGYSMTADRVSIDSGAMELLGARVGDEVGVTSLTSPKKNPRRTRKKKRSRQAAPPEAIS